MEFMIVINTDEKAAAKATVEQQKEMHAAYMAYTQELQKAGVMLHGNGLHRLHVIDAFLIEFFLQAGTHGTDSLRRYPSPSCDLFATAFKLIKQSHGSAPRLIAAQV